MSGHPKMPPDVMEAARKVADTFIPVVLKNLKRQARGGKPAEGTLALLIASAILAERLKTLGDTAEWFELDAGHMEGSVNYQNCIPGLRLAVENLRARIKAIEGGS